MNVLPLKLTPPPKKRICLKYCLGWLKGVCGGRGDQLLDVPFLVSSLTMHRYSMVSHTAHIVGRYVIHVLRILCS